MTCPKNTTNSCPITPTTPAIFAPYLTANLSVPSGVITQLITGNIAIDANTTTAEAGKVFNVFGQNVSGRKIFVLVTFSIVYAGNNQGERQFWIQTSAANTKYGLITQPGVNDGNVLNGSGMLGLDVGESAAFFMFQDSNMSVDLVGGTLGVGSISKWQTVLLT